MHPMTRQKLLPYSFLLPALAITGVVIIYPVFQTLILSIQNYVLYAPDEARYIGLQNFQKLLKDEVFWISLSHSFIWVTSIVVLQLLLGLGSALLLNQSFWWRGVARALVIVPWALPSVIIGLIWTWIYDYNVGVLNDLLLRAHLIDQPVAWLSHPQTSFAAIMLTLVWQGFPFFAVMILAGLQTVPQELYEAARIDGATAFRQFWHVTLPSIAGIMATAVLLRIIWVANSLDIILVMTGGGPGYATYTLPLYAFLRAYSEMEFGYAAALALVMTLLLLGIVFLYVRRQAKELA
jgi:multiple sugar transport system permease protein